MGVNYANDYSDGVRGTDEVRVGPTRLVASGLASPASVKRAAMLSFLVAIVGMCFSGPVFNTQLGIVFWTLAASIFGVVDASRQASPAGGERRG